MAQQRHPAPHEPEPLTLPTSPQLPMPKKGSPEVQEPGPGVPAGVAVGAGVEPGITFDVQPPENVHGQEEIHIKLLLPTTPQPLPLQKQDPVDPFDVHWLPSPTQGPVPIQSVSNVQLVLGLPLQVPG